MADYAYRRLETSDHIRIIELLPAETDNDQIRCIVHHISLEQRPLAYTAISYVWGEDRDDIKLDIRCNGQQARITPNLYSTLSRVRQYCPGRFLWVDALCIDQSSDAAGLAEKERQVRMMDKIFSRAEMVIVDLGETSAPEVMPFLDQFSSIPDQVWDSAEATEGSDGVAFSHEILAFRDLPNSEHPFWEKFASFMQRKWFRRVWIIQEFALAAQATFFVGTDMRPGSFLSLGIVRAISYLNLLRFQDKGFWQHGRSDPRLAKATADILPVSGAVSLIHGAWKSQPHGLPLIKLLRRSRDFQSQKSRDRLYALLGLVSDQSIRDFIAINYDSDDIHPIAMQVSHYLLHSGQGQRMLFNCVGLAGNLASWEFKLVKADAESEDRFADVWDTVLQNSDYSNRFFNASGSTNFTFTWNGARMVQSDSLNQSSALKIRGIFIDRISSLSSALESEDVVHTWIVDAQDWINSVCDRQTLSLHDFAIEVWISAIVGISFFATPQEQSYVRIESVLEAPLWLEAIITYAKVHLLQRQGSTDDAKALKQDINPLLLLNPRFDEYVYKMSRTLAISIRRRLALTETRRILCNLPKASQQGDSIFVILGCAMPFLLRRVEGQSCYKIVGPCYVHGMMDGEALTLEDAYEEDIELE
jgi:hypothetical protein